MANPSERGISPMEQVEADQLLNPRQRLENLLPKLPRQDAVFASAIMSDPQAPKTLFENMAKIIETNFEKAQEKRGERQSAERMDVMEVLKPFSGKERIIIARNLRSMQMTIGCTGGCAWCGAEANRHIEKSFTFDSYKEFMKQYGRYLPRGSNFILYDASDPFDWVGEDGKFSYVDLVNTFGKYSRNRKLFTSTSLPEGSELSFASFMLSYWIDLFDKKSVEEIEKVNYLSGIRFSQRKANEERIGTTLQLLGDLGIGKKFIDATVKIADREGGNSIKKKTKFTNTGYFIDQPDRVEDGRDMLGPFDCDYLCISPSGVYSGLMEAATLVNRKGGVEVRATYPWIT